MRLVKVPFGKRSYEIEIGSGLRTQLGAQGKQVGLAGKRAVISDSEVVASLPDWPSGGYLG